MVEFVKKHLSALHWEAVATAEAEGESEQDEDDMVFIIQKKLWLTSENFREAE
jgi:tellurite resistance protein